MTEIKPLEALANMIGYYNDLALKNHEQGSRGMHTAIAGAYEHAVRLMLAERNRIITAVEARGEDATFYQDVQTHPMITVQDVIAIVKDELPSKAENNTKQDAQP